MGGSGETLPECSGSESQESRGDALDDGHEGIVIRFGPHGRRFVVDQVARIRGERPGQLLGLDEPYPLGREELDDGGAVRSTEPIPGAERRVRPGSSSIVDSGWWSSFPTTVSTTVAAERGSREKRGSPSTWIFATLKGTEPLLL